MAESWSDIVLSEAPVLCNLLAAIFMVKLLHSARYTIWTVTQGRIFSFAKYGFLFSGVVNFATAVIRVVTLVILSQQGQQVTVDLQNEDFIFTFLTLPLPIVFLLIHTVTSCMDLYAAYKIRQAQKLNRQMAEVVQAMRDHIASTAPHFQAQLAVVEKA